MQLELPQITAIQETAAECDSSATLAESSGFVHAFRSLSSVLEPDLLNTQRLRTAPMSPEGKLGEAWAGLSASKTGQNPHRIPSAARNGMIEKSGCGVRPGG
jgi:hypothetical protein